MENQSVVSYHAAMQAGNRIAVKEKESVLQFVTTQVLEKAFKANRKAL